MSTSSGIDRAPIVGGAADFVNNVGGIRNGMTFSKGKLFFKPLAAGSPIMTMDADCATATCDATAWSPQNEAGTGVVVSMFAYGGKLWAADRDEAAIHSYDLGCTTPGSCTKDPTNALTFPMAVPNSEPHGVVIHQHKLYILDRNCDGSAGSCVYRFDGIEPPPATTPPTLAPTPTPPTQVPTSSPTSTPRVPWIPWKPSQGYCNSSDPAGFLGFPGRPSQESGDR